LGKSFAKGSDEFPALFQDVLAGFDGDASSFALQRVQDELIGQMADLLGAAYDTLAAEIRIGPVSG
jgi:hypothetical protein